MDGGAWLQDLRRVLWDSSWQCTGSLVVDHGLWSAQAQELWQAGSLTAVHGLQGGCAQSLRDENSKEEARVNAKISAG